MSPVGPVHGPGRIGISFLLMLCALSLCGCQKSSTPTPAKAPERAQVSAVDSAQVKDLKARLDRLLEPVSYHYSPVGKPDPFQPFLRTTASASLPAASAQGGAKESPRPERCSTALECMDVGQLTLVGIVTRTDGERMAMAQDAAGIGYVLRRGLRIGYHNGRIKNILPDRVIVAEESEDIRGRATVQDRILLLHPEEQ